MEEQHDQVHEKATTVQVYFLIENTNTMSVGPIKNEAIDVGISSIRQDGGFNDNFYTLDN